MRSAELHLKVNNLEPFIVFTAQLFNRICLEGKMCEIRANSYLTKLNKRHYLSMLKHRACCIFFIKTFVHFKCNIKMDVNFYVRLDFLITCKNAVTGKQPSFKLFFHYLYYSLLLRYLFRNFLKRTRSTFFQLNFLFTEMLLKREELILN